jgi:hypothetical protein
MWLGGTVNWMFLAKSLFLKISFHVKKSKALYQFRPPASPTLIIRSGIGKEVKPVLTGSSQ